MNRLADLMEKNNELLATIDTWDNGVYDWIIQDRLKPLGSDNSRREAIQRRS